MCPLNGSMDEEPQAFLGLEGFGGRFPRRCHALKAEKWVHGMSGKEMGDPPRRPAQHSKPLEGAEEFLMKELGQRDRSHGATGVERSFIWEFESKDVTNEQD